MKVRGIFQDIQDSFAEQLQLTVFITDVSGKAVTSFSHITLLSERIIPSMSHHFKEKIVVQSEWLSKIQHPVMVDSQHFSSFMGMKMIVAPVISNGVTCYYIWAGMMIEKGYQAFVIQSFKQNGESEQEKLIQKIAELSMVEMEDKVQKVGKMAGILNELLDSRQTKTAITSIMDVMANTVDETDSIHLRYQPYIEALRKIDKGIDFIAFAKKQRGKHFKVICADGECKEKLGSLVFSVEQTYFEESVDKKEFQIWSHGNSLNSLFLYDLQIHPTALFCFPLISNHQVIGIVFGGSETESVFKSDLSLYGNALVSVLKVHFQRDLMKESLDRHLMRMSSLLEISTVMQMVEKKEDILSMVVDIALQLMAGDFCTATLQNGLSTYKITSPHIHPEDLTRLYINDSKRRLSSLANSKEVPKLVETEWGTVLDFPFYYRKELLGIIIIHLQDPTSINEAEVYMTSLTKSCGVAIKRLETKIKHENEEVLSIDFEKSAFLDVLSSREQDVLQLLAKGLNNHEIAETLYINIHTVKNHITKIFQKLQVSDRSQLIAMIYQLQFIKSTQPS